jgi:TetR/AcrR family transcriptional repressor of nem operon
VARPRTFDPETTLDRAVAIFRSRGWQRTSLDDLVEELGVPRQSLYNTFGDKESFYRAALQRYVSCSSRDFRAAMADPRPIRVVLRETFARKAEEVLLDPAEWGCLVVNATLERPGDAEASAVVRANHEAQEALLADRLRRAQDAGELGLHHDPLALARFLLSALVGMAIVGRGRPDPRALDDVARVALAALG